MKSKIFHHSPKHFTVQKVYLNGEETFTKKYVSSDMINVYCENAAREVNIDYVALWHGSIDLTDRAKSFDVHDYLINEYSIYPDSIKNIHTVNDVESVWHIRDSKGNTRVTEYKGVKVYCGIGRWNLKPGKKTKKRGTIDLEALKFDESI